MNARQNLLMGGLLVAIGCGPRATLTLPSSNHAESDPLLVTCAADQQATLEISSAGLDPSAPPMPPVRPPAPYSTQQTIEFLQTGRSRQGTVTCTATEGGEANAERKPIIIRDGRDPTVNDLDTAGANHRVGETFTVTIDVQDTVAAGLGVVSGIDAITIDKQGPVTFSSRTLDLAGVYPGPPTAAAGPDHPIETVTATCTAAGDVSISIRVLDAAGNDVRSADALMACIP